MKNYIFILLFLSFTGCSKIESSEKKAQAPDSANINENIFSQTAKNKKAEIQKTRNLNSKYYAKLDTVTILSGNGFEIKFDKNKFNKIVDINPEFFDEIVHSPSMTYRNSSPDFSSEAGQDTYYTLYAYFLKQRNGIKKNEKYRKKLIGIYSTINSIFAYLAYGGTYFGHQQSRLIADAEYAVYLNLTDDSPNRYDVSKQKKLYIQSLRQMIDDEVKADTESTDQEKIERTRTMNAFVDELDHLIANLSDLRCAQHFQYEYY